MNSIAVIPNSRKDIGLENTRRLVGCLSGKAHLYMDREYSVIGMGVNYVSSSEIYDNADYAVVLGGDGTILQRAGECAEKHIPVLGINLGKIGFMTEIETGDMESATDKLIKGDFKTERRMMIKACIKRESGERLSFYALNDVVVSKSIRDQLIGIELISDGEPVNKYTADGLIIATPTGSTGYSISAGGPVVDPNMQLFVATPICAHSLTIRSTILSAQNTLQIRIDGRSGGKDAVITADGDMQGYIKDTDEVIITKSENDFLLVKIGSQSFYDTLISKLS